MSTGKRRAKNYLLIPLVSKIVGKVNVNIVDKCATGQQKANPRLENEGAKYPGTWRFVFAKNSDKLPRLYFPFLQVLQTIAFFFSMTDSTDPPDYLPIYPLLFFSFLSPTFLVFGSVW